MVKHWDEIAPKDAVDILLPTEGIIGPVNEQGDICPWPWEPQQMTGVPMGQHHCRFCGAMCLAGLPHPDWTEELKAEAERLAAGPEERDVDNETSWGRATW